MRRWIGYQRLRYHAFMAMILKQSYMAEVEQRMHARA